jgi:hypothetical protein
MTNVLALDVSTKTGWALFQDGKPVSWGTLFPDKTVKDFGDYPINFVRLCQYLADRLVREIIVPILEKTKDYLEVVIEETNSSKQNYSQKILEFLHFCIIESLYDLGLNPKYIRTGEWRKYTDSKMSKEEKALNAKIAKIKRQTGKKLAKIDGKVVGKKGRKHVALRRVEEILGIELMRKDEDAADALLLGLGYLKGAPVCNGTTSGGKSKKE